jgi:hypothetical protein
MGSATRSSILLAAAVAAQLAACAKPAPAPAAPAAEVAAPAPAPASSVAAAAHPSEKLAWLAGAWCGADGDQRIEETWLAPLNNEMIGTSRTIAGGRMVSFEFMRIMDLEGTITYIAQPGGDAPTNFARTDGGDGWIRFENRKHDYPQRIEYRRDGEGLTAEIGGPGAGDKEEVISYRYQRCAR